MPKSNSPPPTPDYTSAAKETAAGNLEMARTQAAANRVNQITPYGSLTYSTTGDKDPYGNLQYTATQSLSPGEQQTYDQNQLLTHGLLDTANKGLTQVDRMLADTSLDESKLAQAGIQGGSVQDAIMARLAPELDRQQASLDTRLANQGIVQGSEAWQNAMGQQARNRNDLQIEAALRGINTANAARQQGIAEQYQAQSRPLDIMNALRTGNQVTNPQFVNVPQQGYTPGADLYGAANAQYNAAMNQYAANQQSSDALLGGLMGMGGMFLGGPGGAQLGSAMGGMFSGGGGFTPSGGMSKWGGAR